VRKTAAVVAATTAIGLVTAGTASAFAGHDTGREREHRTNAGAMRDFGVRAGLASSSAQDISAQEATADPRRLATFAKGLTARVVTSGEAAANLDMGALWPASGEPRYIVYCNEQGTDQPGVQLIDLRDGAATTVLQGTKSCDAAHTTPWGTVVIGEERADGHVYEILDPTALIGHPVTVDRAAASAEAAVPAAARSQVARRDALGANAFEGFGVLPSGVAYYGDELAPSEDGRGGAYHKFVPANPLSHNRIASLDQSPLADGTVYGLRVGDGSNFGQGMPYGRGTWVALQTPGSLRDQRTAQGLTGYYRPEDLSFDEKALARGEVRFCGNNTGREEAHYYGETICITDGTTADALTSSSVPEVQQLVAGSPEFNMPDNIAYQPRRGNWVVHEDAETTFERPHNNDLWSCLDDGRDDDLQSDGCLRIGTLNDLSAEWTGGFFDPSGKHFYVSVQHNTSGHGVILDVTGWR
jgi:secreted PhoX family phosphatase